MVAVRITALTTFFKLLLCRVMRLFALFRRRDEVSRCNFGRLHSGVGLAFAATIYGCLPLRGFSLSPYGGTERAVVMKLRALLKKRPLVGMSTVQVQGPVS